MSTQALIQPTTALRHVTHVLKVNKLSAVALAFLVALLMLAALAPFVVPHDPYATHLDQALQPPNSAHWFGTDRVGRDVFSRVLVAARLDLSIAFSAVLISFFGGTLIGGAAAYFGGRWDRIIGRATDVLMIFPLFVIAMAFVAAFGNSLSSIVLASAIVNVPYFLRLARSEVKQLRLQNYVEAARAGGNSEMRVLLEFMLPNTLPTMSVQLSTSLGWAILNVASLSFIGLGIRPPTAEWGIMVAEGAANLLAGNWWLVVFPGAALTLTVLSFNLLGDGVRDILDVRTKK
ncbi:ABC transporter permease [Paraburkholderia phenoliruptrix]|uniref:ABC transporter permease n=1 Tax=Paraburkholderia phenoliruptrix TaxID=252970 RepID=UPI002869A084|nr:ABC transporter permease [Paraburkholderia phenoliruptrix]WMY10926.1 ABC transporter permease [Paraburkholderia phenoliruptrix]